MRNPYSISNGKKTSGFFNPGQHDKRSDKAKDFKEIQGYFFITESQNILSWTDAASSQKNFSCLYYPTMTLDSNNNIHNFALKINVTELKWQIYHLLLYSFFCVFLHFL